MSTAPTSAGHREAELSAFIERLVAELEPLQRRHNEAVWMANVTGDSSHEQESARLDVQIRSLFARRDSYEFLRALEASGGADDPLLARQLQLLLNDYRAHQIPPEMIERMVTIEKSLESRFNNHRARLDGEPVTDNAIRELLRESNDPERRRRAWEASKQIGAEVAKDLRALVRLRNQAARAIGFPNFYTMALTLDELDETELFALFDEVEQGTRPLFERYKQTLDSRLAERFGVAVEALRPWHYGDPFFQEAPAAEVALDPYFEERSLADLTERFFQAIGFDVRDLLAHSDLYEKPGKCQHAFCMSMDRRDDIRVLCNVRPNEYWMGTMLHEFGHAVYEQGIDRSLPYVLRGPAHTMATEASAMLFGRLSKNAAWLTRYAGAPADEAHAAAAALAQATRNQLLVQTRWCLVMSHMERALYRYPEQDLDALWWGLVERYQWVWSPDGRRAPDWASKIHFSVAPVYYHNYLLGEIMASQLQSHIQREVLGNGADVWERYVASPEVGGFLVQRLYRTGKAHDWRATLREATGRALNTGAFVDELAGGGAGNGR
ncbi:MAG TPA: M2 family metallopeptidase [Candidatus Limnocylindria bacterium]|nr:M2 family metallopeptidase [Candidatus Limnocylindria bacterium]